MKKFVILLLIFIIAGGGIFFAYEQRNNDDFVWLEHSDTGDTAVDKYMDTMMEYIGKQVTYSHKSIMTAKDIPGLKENSSYIKHGIHNSTIIDNNNIDVYYFTYQTGGLTVTGFITNVMLVETLDGEDVENSYIYFNSETETSLATKCGYDASEDITNIKLPYRWKGNFNILSY